MAYKSGVIKETPKTSVFIKVEQNDFISEDSRLNVIAEEKITTLKIRQEKKRFVLLELQRKKKPKILRRIRKGKKYKTKDDIRKAVNNDEIFIRRKQEQRISRIGRRNVKGVSTIQTNYIARIKSDVQLLAVVHVQDIRRNYRDNFLGISNKHKTLRIKEVMARAESECINMAIAKFSGIYGSPKKSGDLFVQILSKRYKYFKVRK